MKDNRLVKISKYLSYHLRHHPDKIGISLAPGGWVDVDELLDASRRDSFYISRTELNEVVAHNDKQRFSFDETDTKIRANQGHSVEIDLQLSAAIPPDALYHGTGQKTVKSILQEGLRKMSRHHVHLSPDLATAKKVGARHGSPVVFTINTLAMQRDNYTFYCSDNGVWLVDYVPPEYLELDIKPNC
ncbi:MAG TPA: RNA 2'-phosphotransferase [Cyanobacteria bacterium UBA11149]|nr:RNA 2'-phosphotransferase [Cyanobacteria bacterium UBA11367]HBE59836.1 RNA 2'-phosphotransferase [Cyanobacteria bacterium UBA11366]HBR76119.1 RNA 2'-phosphotransferase [Cyanobacteria bacterium UBA11159]HBS70613.1 RNA 2'-phosphotransferase [Cyanobacteria bacterium UBA11153]HBW92310.1 RNA 2'-phosphotransferase [Cyanobacteria bacterium UBA11149]HCA94928.1 RNA 2'-phosphotransferase [Cyanobacteria bacterium UBA9226]